MKEGEGDMLSERKEESRPFMSGEEGRGLNATMECIL